MAPLTRIKLAWKALIELGPGQLAQYAWYHVLLRTGYLRRATRDVERVAKGSSPSPVIRRLFILPPRERLASILGVPGSASLLAEAEEILSGRIRLFGGPPVPLKLRTTEPLAHWTVYERGRGNSQAGEEGDTKFVWEPGRFGWAYTLARAYYLSRDERYAQGFWEFTETFLDANPPYLGLHWVSAQEVALRLIALVFSSAVFSTSAHSTRERTERLAESIAAHARRIPPSMAYARAQNNNHLLSEAVGLYTAGIALSEHPQAAHWRELGWRWFHRGLQAQVAEDGAFTQNSTNYHRLMLQLALWVHSISWTIDRPFPQATQERLAAATHWLSAMLDAESGCVPNLGPNDGAYIQPLTACPFGDYRPVLQVASEVFLGECLFPAGPWDELRLWLGFWDQGTEKRQSQPSPLSPTPLSPVFPSPHVIHSPHSDSWAYLRAARFRSRPGHADQLHLDLWWRGVNLAQDAGTYLYNAPPPWDNALACTGVHNTLAVAGLDQMSRAGRFLWLDWAQAQVVSRERAGDGSWERVTAQHDGYRRLGLVHQRAVTAFLDGRWVIEDRILKAGGLKGVGFKRQPVPSNLHWLLPDWEWQLVEEDETQVEIRLSSAWGPISLKIQAENGASLAGVWLTRAGQMLAGSGEVASYQGWVSPTYGQKLPALSLTVTASGKPPYSLVTHWLLPPDRIHSTT